MKEGMRKLHLGCANITPGGWINLDGSWNAWLAKHSFLRRLAGRLGLVPGEHLIIPWSREILVHDVRRGLPFPANHFGAIYASHLIEHLHLAEGKHLLKECWRTLEPGGTLRIVVPDLRSILLEYLRDSAGPPARREGILLSPADRLCQRLAMHPCAPPKGHFLYRLYSRLKQFHVHKWMFDADSLARHLSETGFVRITRLTFGGSRIPGIEDVEGPSRGNGRQGIFMEGSKPHA